MRLIIKSLMDKLIRMMLGIVRSDLVFKTVMINEMFRILPLQTSSEQKTVTEMKLIFDKLLLR